MLKELKISNMRAVLIKQQILNTFILEHSHAIFRYITNRFLFFSKVPFHNSKRRELQATFCSSDNIFRDTLIVKNLWRRRGSNPRPTGWETKKSKHQPGFEPRTYNLTEPHGLEIKRSFGRICEEKTHHRS